MVDAQMSRFLVLLFLILLSFPVYGEGAHELYRIRVTNAAKGPIEVSRNQGVTWETVGRVIYPTDQVNRRGFTAAKWVSPWEVAASAVNAIHIKTSDPSTIFSILPKDMLRPPSKYNSYLSADSSIYTDIPAGTLIFGGRFSPYVGNQVSISGRRYYGGDTPEIENEILIVVKAPKDQIRQIVFENRFAGEITATFSDGEEEIIGEVLRPVMGIGRFPGSKYLEPGRIRAVHAGVIDVSTSLGEDRVGGFQIVPAYHAMSPEMKNARLKTQWMVIGPPSVIDEALIGQPPFFKGYIKPDYEKDDLNSKEWERRLLERFLVEVRVKGSTAWVPMPVLNLYADESLPKWADSALQDITHFRILFPVY